MAYEAPVARPVNPRFSSGPCAKIPGFSLDMLADAPLGRSHRAAVGKAKLKEAIETTREILGVPADYRIGIVPASGTGAVEMALWSLLGARPVTMCAWESFGSGWVTDVVKQLKIDADVKKAEYGDVVDFTDARCCHMAQIKTPDLGGIHNIVESVLYCNRHGMEAYQGGTCNETDVSARTCVHLALAARPMRMLVKPGMGFDEGMNIVHNEMHRTLAQLKTRRT